jgi:hypothetical protein
MRIEYVALSYLYPHQLFSPSHQLEYLSVPVEIVVNGSKGVATQALEAHVGDFRDL